MIAQDFNFYHYIYTCSNNEWLNEFSLFSENGLNLPKRIFSVTAECVTAGVNCVTCVTRSIALFRHYGHRHVEISSDNMFPINTCPAKFAFPFASRHLTITIVNSGVSDYFFFQYKSLPILSNKLCKQSEV